MSKISGILLVIRDGKKQLSLEKVEERIDGTLWYQGSPILDSQAPGGLSKEELAPLTRGKKYDKIPAASFAKRGENPSGLLVLTQAEWDACPENVAARQAAERKEAERQARIESLFPGLKELEAAADDEERYGDQFIHMVNDESNDGAWPPKPIKVRYADLVAKYPVAATYLKARRLAETSHWASGRGGIYQRAVTRMESGEDAHKVFAEAEAEWSEVARKGVQNS